MIDSQTTTAREWNVDAETYHAALDIIGNSSKERFHRSKRDFQEIHVAQTKQAPPPSEDLLIGIWTHIAIWEPERWAAEFCCDLPPTASDGNKWHMSRKGHKEEKQAFLAAHPNALTTEQRQLVENLKAALWRCPVSRNLLDIEGRTERSLVWTDEESGINCKSRQDKIFDINGPVIVDLKTTRSAVNRESLRRLIHNFGLCRNADFYIRGHHELTGQVPTYVFLFVSKLTFECAAVDLSQEWLTLGHQQNQVILNDMARCYETGDWLASHEKEIMQLDPPRYAYTNPDVETD